MRRGAAAAAAANSQYEIEPFKARAGWTPLRRLGGGCVSQVVLAAGPGGQRRAIKTLRRSLIDHPGAERVLRHEHAVLRRLQGPGIVTLLQRRFAGCIHLEYLAGGDLLTMIGSPPRAWAGCLAALAVALDRVHAAGWVHRDVRPENALLRSPRDPVWIDFGAAARIGRPAAVLGAGTRAYASPQQQAGLHPDRRDDVYGFGALLCHLITGAPPESRLPPPARLAGGRRSVEDVALPLREWLMAALAPGRSARPGDLRAIAQLLAGLQD